LLLRQLRCFSIVAEQRSVVRAAKALGVAQPALSRALQSLERYVGVRLLDRGSRGVSLTAAGAALHEALDPVLRQLDEALRRVHLADDGRVGTLRVGLARAAIDNPRLSRAFAALREALPDLSVVISELDSGVQPEALRSGALDLAIGILGTTEAKLHSIPLCDLRIDSAVLPGAHRLAKAESVSVDDLREECFLITGPVDTPPFSDLLDELRRQGVERWEIHQSLASVFSFVAAGCGWTAVPTDLGLHPPAGVVMRPLRGFNVALVLRARWRSGNHSRLVANAVALLQGMMTPRVIESGDRPVVMASAPPVPGAVRLQHLRALLAVGDTGSMSHGAHRLGITQSALTRRIRSLEHDVGAVLLRRHAGGSELTAAGALLQQAAMQTLSLIDEAIACVNGVARAISGRCSIATPSTEFTEDLLSPAIRQISRQHPGVSIQIEEMLSLSQIAQLHERHVDIGICGAHLNLADEPLIDSRLISEDVMDSALVSENHPLAARKRLAPSDLATIPFCFLDRATDPTFHDMVMDSFRAIGLVPQIITSLNGLRAMWRAAADLGGWALGTRSSRHRPPAGMVAIRIECLHIPSGFKLVWRRDERDPAVIAVLHALRRLHASPLQET
jgi:DNA-binding transcriptional LysR family regulator